jgi:hypothetical protein
MPIITSLLKAKFEISDEQVGRLDNLEQTMTEQFRQVTAREEVKVVV